MKSIGFLTFYIVFMVSGSGFAADGFVNKDFEGTVYTANQSGHFNEYPLGWNYVWDSVCNGAWWTYKHNGTYPTVYDGIVAWNCDGKALDPCTGGPLHNSYTYCGLVQSATVIGGRNYTFRIWTKIEWEAGTWSGNGQYFTPYIKVQQGTIPPASWSEIGAVPTIHTGYYGWLPGEFNIDVTGSGPVTVTCFLVTVANGTYAKVIYDKLEIIENVAAPTPTPTSPPASGVISWPEYR